jgi:D-glycero-D-manno-heptose 1,7-bisphosphate phosphatase
VRLRDGAGSCLAAPVVFLDRDGTINRKPAGGDYVKRWEEFAFLPGAVGAIGELSRAGFRVIVVTNQRGIALGRMRREDVDDIHRRMLDAIAAEGGHVDSVLVCPHGHDECGCRKPRPGLMLRAARERGPIDFSRAAIVGDSLSDVQAGAALDMTTVLVADAPPPEVSVRVTHVARSLADAAAWIIEERRGAPSIGAP